MHKYFVWVKIVSLNHVFVFLILLADYTLHTNKKIKTTRKLQELAAELMTVNGKYSFDN